MVTRRAADLFGNAPHALQGGQVVLDKQVASARPALPFLPKVGGEKVGHDLEPVHVLAQQGRQPLLADGHVVRDMKQVQKVPGRLPRPVPVVYRLFRLVNLGKDLNSAAAQAEDANVLRRTKLDFPPGQDWAK
jgi:hypothetical protein